MIPKSVSGSRSIGAGPSNAAMTVKHGSETAERAASASATSCAATKGATCSAGTATIAASTVRYRSAIGRHGTRHKSGCRWPCSSGRRRRSPSRGPARSSRASRPRIRAGGRPARDVAVLRPMLDLRDERGVAYRQILCAVIERSLTQPRVDAAGRHAATGPAALFRTGRRRDPGGGAPARRTGPPFPPRCFRSA